MLMARVKLAPSDGAPLGPDALVGLFLGVLVGCELEDCEAPEPPRPKTFVPVAASTAVVPPATTTTANTTPMILAGMVASRPCPAACVTPCKAVEPVCATPGI